MKGQTNSGQINPASMLPASYLAMLSQRIVPDYSPLINSIGSIGDDFFRKHIAQQQLENARNMQLQRMQHQNEAAKTLAGVNTTRDAAQQAQRLAFQKSGADYSLGRQTAEDAAKQKLQASGGQLALGRQHDAQAAKIALAENKFRPIHTIGTRGDGSAMTPDRIREFYRSKELQKKLLPIEDIRSSDNAKGLIDNLNNLYYSTGNISKKYSGIHGYMNLTFDKIAKLTNDGSYDKFLSIRQKFLLAKTDFQRILRDSRSAKAREKFDKIFKAFGAFNTPNSLKNAIAAFNNFARTQSLGWVNQNLRTEFVKPELKETYGRKGTPEIFQSKDGHTYRIYR